MKIGVIGAGYVGAVTAACLAELGHTVVCTDPSEAVIEAFQQAHPPFYEPGLQTLIERHLASGHLTFTLDSQQAVDHGDIIYLCVLVMPLANGKPDLKPLQQAVKTMTQCMRGHKLIVEKTTLPLKTGDWLKQLLRQQLPPEVSFDLAVVPHFMREGSAIDDFLYPDRLVIGAETLASIETLTALYAPIQAPLLLTDINSAELIKHASNAFLAMKISFINTIAHLCEKTGADVQKVSKGLGLDHRIAPEFLNAGIGYGGIFFSKDIHSLMSLADQHHINLDLLKATEVINRYQRLHFVEKLEAAVGGSLEGKTLAIWGLAYRPNTDDMRDTPSLHIIRSLRNRGAQLRVYDPLAMPHARQVLGDMIYAHDLYEAAHDADAIAILTEWHEFQVADFDRLANETHCRTIVDGRNLFDPAEMKARGFYYVSMGRPPQDGRRALMESR